MGWRSALNEFLAELRRRRVLRSALAYLVVAWLVVQVVDIVGPALSLPSWTLSYVIVSLIVGFPVALVLSWFFAITRRGLQLESELESSSPQPGDRVMLTIISILAAALVVSLISRESPTFHATVPSLAVLPFTNISGNAEDESFVAGLHEDLLTQLSRIKAMKVISRTSVLRYGGTRLPIPTIAKQLGVSSVIEGSVQKIGQRLRIQIQLIDGASDQHLWADSFDRRLTANDIFDIQREVALAVADAFDARLSSVEQDRLSEPATTNLEAYSAYMFGKQKIEKRTSVALDDAIEHLRRAIRLDPGFAAAHAQLAMAYDLASWYGDLSRESMLSLAMPAAQRAIDLDPTLVEGWTALADLRLMSGDDSGAEAAFKKAVALNPNYPVALHWYALLLMDRGDFEAALALHQKALALDPLSVTLTNNVAQDLYYLDRKTEALTEYERSLELDPNFAATHAHMANIYAYGFGRPDEAVRWLRSAAQLDNRHTEYPSQLAMLLVDLDDPDMAASWAQRALPLGPNRIWPNLAMLTVSHRQDDAAAMQRFGETLLALDSGSWRALHALRNLELAAGRPDAARARYAESLPELFQKPPRVTETNYLEAIDLALVLQQLGEPDAAETLLELASQISKGRPRSGPTGIYFADIEILAMRGDTKSALDTLEQAAQSGWTEFWWQAPLNPNLTKLHRQPRFDAAMATFRSRAADFRANVDLPESD